MRQIALVDDDNLFRESVGQNLTDAGFAVTAYDRGEALLDALGRGGAADIVLLDWKMPGLSGIEVLRRMRDMDIAIPVIFLTLLSDQVYEEAALATGAVDFVEKSRSFHILRRRIELILEGQKGEAAPNAPRADDPEIVRVGALELRPGSGRACWQGAELPLTLNEFNMVRYLAENAGKDVRYRELYDQVRGSGFSAGVGTDGFKTNVRTFIKRIRTKFRNADPAFDQIENYPGFGYRWRHETA
jgi:two-component system response regulator ChvI